MPILSKNKILELKRTLNDLKKSLAIDNELNTKMGGPMDSFKETASYSVTVKAKEFKINEIIEILSDTSELPDKIIGNSIILGKWFVISNGYKDIRYRLVDPIEADPSKSLISYRSPLGVKVLGKKIQENFILNGNTFTIKFIE